MEMLARGMPGIAACQRLEAEVQAPACPYKHLRQRVSSLDSLRSPAGEDLDAAGRELPPYVLDVDFDSIVSSHQDSQNAVLQASTRRPRAPPLAPSPGCSIAETVAISAGHRRSWMY